MRTRRPHKSHGFTLTLGLIALAGLATLVGLAAAPAGEGSLPAELDILRKTPAHGTESETRRFVIAVPEGTETIVVAAEAECQTAWSRLDPAAPERSAQDSLGLTLRLDRCDAAQRCVAITAPGGTPALNTLTFRFFRGDPRRSF